MLVLPIKTVDKGKNKQSISVENATKADPQQEKLLEALKDVTSKSGASKFAYNRTHTGITLYVGSNEEEAGRIYSSLPSQKRKSLNKLIKLIGDQIAKLKGFIQIHNHFK